ncbi:MAG: HlyD family efflux transporter periplasmic adaptor subunit [Romboutsia sp.]|nr:HlyD family efflux transporter periplasmic adaptor subunit [Romboutsia sp.]
MALKKKSLILIGGLVIATIGIGVLFNNGNKKNIGITEEQVQIKDIKTYYTFSGDVKAKKSESISLNSNTKISEIFVKEGDIVKEGDKLFKTSSGNLIKANLDGQVSEILVSEDVDYTTGTPLATVINYDKLEVEIKVDEYESNSIEIGDEVDVYVNALDKTVEGKIINLSKNATVVNDVSYFRCIVELEEAADILVGMSVEVKALKDSAKEAKTIPMSALEFDSDNQAYVYVKNSDGEIVERMVTIGINDGSLVEIKSGLKANETVLSSNKSAIFDPFEMMNNGGK